MPPKLLGPDLDSQDGFNINRARIGVRGTGFPLDSRINYFALLEMGNNGITAWQRRLRQIDRRQRDPELHSGCTRSRRPVQDPRFRRRAAGDSCIRLHQLHRSGQRPACWSGSPTRLHPSRRGNHARIPTAATGNVGPFTEAQLQGGAKLNQFDSPVGAFRDVGVQVFDAFDVGNDWEVSYAAMIGNGNGIEFSNSDGEYDKYLYLSAEKKLGGKGPKAEGLKFFAWGQWGIAPAGHSRMIRVVQPRQI